MPITNEAVMERRARAQRLMVEADIDLLVIGPSADFRYLTGYPSHPSERLTALALTARGGATLVVPRLEAPLYPDLSGQLDFDIWDESANPIALVSEIATRTNASTVAVNNELWSGFLLEMEERLPRAGFLSARPVMKPLRMIKDAAELELLSEAARRTDAAWEEFCATQSLTGKSEREVATTLRALMAKHGIPTVAFCIVASGPNGASPHHRTGDRRIQPGDPVVIDFGGVYEGYYSDITRTPVAGEPDPEFITVYDTVLTAQQAAFAAIKPGVPCQEIDRAARQVIASASYGEYFVHRVGHGLGLTEHEDPYLVEGNADPLAPGMVVSDEPGIYVPDRWGVRIEDTVVVTQDGAERINHVPRDLTSLP